MMNNPSDQTSTPPRTVWVIVKHGSTAGHRDSNPYTQLAAIGPYGTGGYHPAFDTEQAELDYIATQHFIFGERAVPLKIA